MKSTQVEVLNRVQIIAKELLKGKSRQDILHFTSNWCLSDRQVDNYVKEARELIETSVKRNINYDYSVSVSQLFDLFEKAYEGKDWKTCLSIRAELNKLQGLTLQSNGQTVNNNSVNFICNF